jgi:hypothetical protein
MYGVEVQTLLLEWIKASQTALVGETAQSADERTASNVAGLKRVLSQQNVTYINGTLSAIETALSGAQPSLAKTSCGRPPPSADGGVTPPPTQSPGADGGTPTTTPQGGRCTTVGTVQYCQTGKPGNTTKSPPPTTRTRASLEGKGAPAGVILADMFAQTRTAAPSRGLLTDWDTLRARWQATAARAATSQLARDLVREARRVGSMTIAREGARASLKFDQGAALVDHFVAARIGFSADAMGAVHAVVAERAHGHIRRAGENVQAGSDHAHAYLPGAEVEGAVASLFAGVRRGASRGMATPELAATFDQRLISIHPFLDANGRTTRLMTDWLLLRGGYPPVAGGVDTRSAALFWQKSASQRDREAHLARITSGMQRTLALVEQVVA